MSTITEPAAARTLRNRLERAGLVAGYGADYLAWEQTLHAYEQIMAKEIRMATFALTSQRPRETVTEDEADAAAYERLAEAVAAFDAHGATARDMIAWLGRWLDVIAALPVEAGVEAHQRGQRYLAYRYGRLPLLPPLRKRQAHHWPWTVTLQAHEQAGWRLAVACRTAWRVLTPAQQLQAVADFGPFHDRQTLDTPLWLAHFPADELRALDGRASTLGVDPRRRAVTKRGEGAT